MLRADRRFVVSHVGSLVRPPAMIPFLHKHQAGEPYDKPAYEACLADAVIEAVRLQAETGIDVVSDGEYGKSGTWAFYVHRRLGGLEWRPLTEAEATDPMNVVMSGRDREAFPEFRRVRRARACQCVQTLARSSPPHWAIPARPNWSATSPTSRPVSRGRGGGRLLPVVAPASALPTAKNEHYRDEESFLFALAEALRNEYRAIIDAGMTFRSTTRFSR